jgi:lysophospholipase L1-like esterase
MVPSVVLGFGAVLVIAEFAARLLTAPETVHAIEWVTHAELGWLPPPGLFRHVTREFDATYDVNEHYMNDRPVADPRTTGVRMLALGDSHTFALGVSQREAWPNVLEDLLFGGDEAAGAVYNLGVIGYGLGQYLYQLRRLGEELAPEVVLIGFSMATDLYDIIPPRLGGFVYAQRRGRGYFDLDSEGHLVEHRELEGETLVDVAAGTVDVGARIRETLGGLALYQRLKRSKLALWLAIRFSDGNVSLWPGMETALKKERNESDLYRWTLAEALISRIADEARSRGSKVVLVNIPYLAQVYDDVWNASFGLASDRYDRWIGAERLRAICDRAAIGYIDTTPAFVSATRATGHWLHFREDGHPTSDGQRLIARVVAAELAANQLVETARSAPRVRP